MPVLKWEVKFEPRDLWVGVFWDFKPRYFERPERGWIDEFHLYICPLPMLLLHIWRDTFNDPKAWR